MNNYNKDIYKEGFILWLMGLIPSVCTGMVIPWMFFVVFKVAFEENEIGRNEIKNKNVFDVEFPDKIEGECTTRAEFIKDKVNEFAKIPDGDSFEIITYKRIQKLYPFLCIDDEKFRYEIVKEKNESYYDLPKIGSIFYVQNCHSHFNAIDDKYERLYAVYQSKIWCSSTLEECNREFDLFREELIAFHEELLLLNKEYENIINLYPLRSYIYMDYIVGTALELKSIYISCPIDFGLICSWFDGKVDPAVIYDIYDDKDNWYQITTMKYYEYEEREVLFPDIYKIDKKIKNKRRNSRKKK